METGRFSTMLCALAAFLLTGCEGGRFDSPEPELPIEPNLIDSADKFTGWTQTLPPMEYPARLTLTDVEGRKLKAAVIGRDESSVTLVREADGKRFNLPLDRLSRDDRGRVTTLPLKEAPAKSPMESRLYRMRLASLDEIDARIEALETELNSTSSSIRLRSNHSELGRLREQRYDLLEALKDLERF